jgi:hypothetical protein
MLSVGVFSIECFGLWVSGLVFSLNAWDEMWLWIHRYLNATIVKERKKQQEMLLRVMRASPLALGTTIQRV